MATNPKPIRFADMSPKERVNHVAYKTLETADVRKVKSMCDLLYQTAGAAGEGNIGLVVGDTGAGKTTAVKMFTDELFLELQRERPGFKWHRPSVGGTDLQPIVQQTDTGYLRPVVVVGLVSQPNFKSLLQDTALAMQVELPTNFKIADAMRKIQHAIVKQEIRMIIFDEVQHIVEGKRIDTYAAADVFKIMCKCRVQVLCVGMISSLELPRINSQFARLMMHRHVIQPLPLSLGDFPLLDAKGDYATHDVNGRPVPRELQPGTPYRKFLAALDVPGVLPFDVPSNLSHPTLALPIHRATGGFVGKIMKLVQRTTLLVADAGKTKLSKGAFASVVERTTNCSDAANWFKMEWPTIAALKTPLVASNTELDEKTEKMLLQEEKKAKKRAADALAGR